MAYDQLHEASPARADREYLEILHLAAHESEEAVEDALRVLMEREQPIRHRTVEEAMRKSQAAPAVTIVTVATTNLADFDTLFTEEWHDPRDPVYWKGMLKRDEGRLTHRIKTLYGFFTLKRFIENDATQMKAEDAFLYVMA